MRWVHERRRVCLAALLLASCVLAPVHAQGFGSQVSTWFDSLSKPAWPPARAFPGNEDSEIVGHFDLQDVVTGAGGRAEWLVDCTASNACTPVEVSQYGVSTADCADGPVVHMAFEATFNSGTLVDRIISTPLPLQFTQGKGGTLFLKIQNDGGDQASGVCASSATLVLEYNRDALSAITEPLEPSGTQWREYGEFEIDGETLETSADLFFPLAGDTPPMDGPCPGFIPPLQDDPVLDICNGFAWWRIRQVYPTPALAEDEATWLVESITFRGTINEPLYVTLVAAGVGLGLGIYWVLLDRHFYKRAARRNRYLLMGIKFLERDVNLHYKYFDKVFSTMALFWEFVQLSSFSFIKSVPWWNYDYYFAWIPTLSLVLFDRAYIIFFLSAAGLYVFFGVYVVGEEIFRARNINPRRHPLTAWWFRSALHRLLNRESGFGSALGSFLENLFSGRFWLEIMLIPSLRTFFGILTCDYNMAFVPYPALRKAEAVMCWQQEHLAYAAVAVFVIGGILPTSLRYAAVKDCSHSYLTYIPRFRVELVILKVLLTAVSTLVEALVLITVLLSCGINISLMISNVRHQPCLSPKNMWANHVRTAVFGGAFWSGFCAFLAIILETDDGASPFATLFYFSGLPVVMIILYMFDRWYSKYRLPISPDTSAKQMLTGTPGHRLAALKLLENTAVMESDGAAAIQRSGLLPTLVLIAGTEDGDDDDPQLEEARDKAESIIVHLLLRSETVVRDLIRLNAIDTVIEWLDTGLFQQDDTEEYQEPNYEYLAALEIVAREGEAQLALLRNDVPAKLARVLRTSELPITRTRVERSLQSLSLTDQGKAAINATGLDAEQFYQDAVLRSAAPRKDMLDLGAAGDGDEAGDEAGDDAGDVSMIKAIVREKRATLSLEQGSEGLASLQSMLANPGAGGSGAAGGGGRFRLSLRGNASAIEAGPVQPPSEAPPPMPPPHYDTAVAARRAGGRVANPARKGHLARQKKRKGKKSRSPRESVSRDGNGNGNGNGSSAGRRNSTKSRPRSRTAPGARKKSKPGVGAGAGNGDGSPASGSRQSSPRRRRRSQDRSSSQQHSLNGGGSVPKSQ